MKTKIPIKKYVDDEGLAWPERYKRLNAHHLEETQFLIGRIEELENEVTHLNNSLEAADARSEHVVRMIDRVTSLEKLLQSMKVDPQAIKDWENGVVPGAEKP